EEPPHDSEIRQLIREECCVEVPEKQKQSMEETMLELVKIFQEKEFLCIHDDVDDLIKSAPNSKLLLINSNSQRLDKKEQEVKNVVEQPVERGNRSIKSLQNFKVVHKYSISFRNTSQISSIHAIAHILSTKELEHLLSMRYEHLSITLETESDEVTESNAENLLPIPSKCEVALEDKRECDFPISEKSPVCDNHYDIFSDSKIDDDISVYDDDFEDIECVEASLFDPEIISVEEENSVEEESGVQQEEEEIDLEDISQIQDVVLREKLLSIILLISNIESLNDNPTPNHVLNSFKSDNSLSENFSPEFETFCDHSEGTRSDNTTHADNSLPEYDSFCFEIEPDQERLINLVKSNILDNSSNDSFLEEADLFLASDNSIPPGIENVADDPEVDIRFLEELLIDESSDSNFEDNPLIPLPPPEPPDKEFDFEIAFENEISVVRSSIVKFECIDARVKFDVFNDENNVLSYLMFEEFSFLFAESEDTIFDHGQGNIIKTSALPHDITPRVTSLDADEGSMQQQLQELTDLCTRLQRQQTKMATKIIAQDLEISSLKARIKLLEDKDKGTAELSRDDAPIKGRSLETGEEAGVERSTERGSNDTEELVNVLFSMDAAIILTSGVQAIGVPPVAEVSTVGVPTGSGLVSTVSAIFTTANVEQMARENQKIDEQIARDAKIARIQAEEEMQMLIDGLDKNNEVIAKNLHEEKFILVWKQIENFVPMASKEEGERVKRKWLKLEQGSAKK
nr:hypothetical protein [Tanacetum cinerariifolium]